MSDARPARMNLPVAVLLLGVGLLAVGLLLAGMPGLLPATTTPYPGGLGPAPDDGLAVGPLGVALLASGVGLGAGVVGHLLGSRRPTA